MRSRSFLVPDIIQTFQEELTEYKERGKKKDCQSLQSLLSQNASGLPQRSATKLLCRVGAWMESFLIELEFAIAQYRSTMATCHWMRYRVTSALLVDINIARWNKLHFKYRPSLHPLARRGGPPCIDALPPPAVVHRRGGPGLYSIHPTADQYAAKLKTVYTLGFVP